MVKHATNLGVGRAGRAVGDRRVVGGGKGGVGMGRGGSERLHVLGE